MKLLLDTNVILDVLAKREGFYDASAAIWKLCEIKRLSGSISALSIANIMYILRKELSPEKIEKVVQMLGMIFEIVELGQDDLLKASSIQWTDFEDAIQYVTAIRIHAECIVTRNVTDYKADSINVKTPSQLLSDLN